MAANPAAAPQTPVEIVEDYLRLHMIPDPDSARQFCAPDLEIRFTGNRLMHDPAEATAFNKARYKWVKKKFGPTHVVAGGTRGRDHRLPDRDPLRRMAGRHAFEGNRYVDRYVVQPRQDRARWKSGTTAPSG